MLKRNLTIIFFIISQLILAQEASIIVETREILTYPYSDPNPVPSLVEGKEKIYPYHTFNGYTLTGKMQKFDVVKMENDYIEVYVLPSDGGKVWGAIEKSTGKEFLYRNEVMKYRNISQRGPWTSGGIEFNFGYIGHHPSTTVSVDHKIVENADGSVSCFIGSLDLPSRTKWQVEIRLPKDKAYFETRAMWSNPSPLPQSYYNWMTGAAVVSDDLEFFYPGNQELDHDGSAGPWPVDEQGRNVAIFSNNAFGSNRSSHVVGEYNDFMGGYYHKSDFGFGHWALYDEMPGRKLWLWSQARSGGIWEDLLTDSDGQYMEFQAGRMLNQYSPSSRKTPITQVPFAPGVTDTWNEIWFPVKEIGGFVDVSPAGVLNVKREDGKLLLGVNALAFAKAEMTVKSDGKIIYKEDRDFSPMEVFRTSVPLSQDAGFEVEIKGMDLMFGSENKNLLKRPFKTNVPADNSSAAALYHQGMEEKEGRSYESAKSYFERCLRKDPAYIDAMTALTEIHYRKNQYDSALYYADKALQLDAYDPAVNYYAGITYDAKGDHINALETLGWAARSPEFRSAAYAGMAGIQVQLQNSQLAEHYAIQSLDFNKYNFNALQVLTVLNRNAGNNEQAQEFIERILLMDPLNHFADFEMYLLDPSDDNYRIFTSTIKNEMPYQTFLELCLTYYGMGLNDDALRVLEKAPAHPLVTVWRAYLANDPGLLSKASEESPEFVFPYRNETVSALEWAVSKHDSWKLRYYLALNYLAILREKESLQMLISCGQEPDYAPFYLSRASIRGNDHKELDDIETAYKLAPDNWRTATRLIRYYENQQNDQMALAVSSPAYKKFNDNFIIGQQYAAALLNNGKYTECIKILAKMHVLPNEGASQGRVVYEQAYLLHSLELIKSKKYKEALKALEKSGEWPEKLGVGMPYEPDNRIQDFLTAHCLNKLNRSNEALKMENAVIDFTLKRASVPSFNNLLALLVYKGRGETGAAQELLQRSGNSKNQQWIKAVFNNEQDAANVLEKEFENNNYFLIIKKISDL